MYSLLFPEIFGDLPELIQNRIKERHLYPQTIIQQLIKLTRKRIEKSINFSKN